MTFNILFVCSANVCRSPLAATLMSNYLHRAGTHTEISVSSAGVHASRGAERCSSSAAWLKKNLYTVPAHSSRRALPSLTQEADLILVTDRGVHASLLRSAPLVRSHAFTIREAIVLGQEAAINLTPVGDADQPTSPDGTGNRVPSAGPLDRLAWWVEEMNALRGLVSLGTPPSAHWYHRRRSASPYDIPDAHGGDRSWGHRPVLSLTQKSVESVASIVAGVVAGPGAHAASV